MSIDGCTCGSVDMSCIAKHLLSGPGLLPVQCQQNCSTTELNLLEELYQQLTPSGQFDVTLVTEWEKTNWKEMIEEGTTENSTSGSRDENLKSAGGPKGSLKRRIGF